MKVVYHSDKHALTIYRNEQGLFTLMHSNVEILADAPEKMIYKLRDSIIDFHNKINYRRSA